MVGLKDKERTWTVLSISAVGAQGRVRRRLCKNLLTVCELALFAEAFPV